MFRITPVKTNPMGAYTIMHWEEKYKGASTILCTYSGVPILKGWGCPLVSILALTESKAGGYHGVLSYVYMKGTKVSTEGAMLHN